MSHQLTHKKLPFSFRRLWRPVAITGAGGAAIAIWLEEIIAFGEEILALIFLPILVGVVYLLDIFIFKSRLPKRDDMTRHEHRDTHDKPSDIGAKK